jgi:dolichol-phosphate mannosyltransferase
MLSVVVPSLNERGSLCELTERIRGSVSSLELTDWEVIFVDDGSTDGSWDTICGLSAADSRVRGIRFRRNFGKAAALAAGFHAACGQVVITMDADLQDEPREIGRLIAKLDEGYHVVSGWKQTRYDPWHKRWPSLAFNWILRTATKLDLHDFNCGLKAYRHEVLGEIDLFGEMHRFIPVLAAARGFRVTEVAVEHHPRLHGESKYGWSRIPKGLMDLLTVVFVTRFRYRPQHLLGGLGFLACSVGTLLLMVLVIAWGWTRLMAYEDPINLHQRALFYFAILSVLIGLQLIGVGLLAELVVANSVFRRTPYSISATVGESESSDKT